MRSASAAILFLILFLSNSLLAQEPRIYDNPQIGAGIYIAGKAGVNGVESPEDRKNKFALNNIPDFGIKLQWKKAAGGKVALLFDLGYSSYSYYVEHIPTSADYKHNYYFLNLGPTVKFRFIYAGFNFGIPATANVEEREIETADLNIIAELFIGGEYTLFKDDTGEFNIYAETGYMLSPVYDNFYRFDPLKEILPGQQDNVTSQFNPRVFSISVGISYLFYF